MTQTIDRKVRLDEAREFIASLPRTRSGFPKCPKTGNAARPSGPSRNTGAVTHYFLTTDGNVYGHKAPTTMIAERFGRSTYGAGTVHIGFSTHHAETGEYSLNGRPEVL